MGSSFTKLVAIDFGIQWTGFFIANLFKTEKFYDLAGSLTNILLTVLSVRMSRTMVMTNSQVIQSSCVLLWATRLGLYLFTRVLRDGEDRRFRQIKTNPTAFFFTWTLQGLWVLITLMPSLLANLRAVDSSGTQLNWKQKVGWSLFAVGFFIEALADHQKSNFRANPDNASQFISTGLWSVVRHPNYLGEIILWSGLGIAALPSLRGLERWSALVSPVFISLLLTQVSGIPMLEKSGIKRWGADPRYQQYLRNTPRLLPFIW